MQSKNRNPASAALAVHAKRPGMGHGLVVHCRIKLSAVIMMDDCELFLETLRIVQVGDVIKKVQMFIRDVNVKETGTIGNVKGCICCRNGCRTCAEDPTLPIWPHPFMGTGLANCIPKLLEPFFHLHRRLPPLLYLPPLGLLGFETGRETEPPDEYRPTGFAGAA